MKRTILVQLGCTGGVLLRSLFFECPLKILIQANCQKETFENRLVVTEEILITKGLQVIELNYLTGDPL